MKVKQYMNLTVEYEEAIVEFIEDEELYNQRHESFKDQGQAVTATSRQQETKSDQHKALIPLTAYSLHQA